MRGSPFGFWIEMWGNGLAMAETGLRVAETLAAAGTVIDSRSRTIAASSRDPLNADHRELGRMIPEKIDAFSHAGASMLRDMGALQADALANWQALGRMALAGRPPSSVELSAVTGRTSRMMARTAEASGRALAPVHRRATANAKRLKPRPR